MSVLLPLVGRDVALRSRHVFRAPLHSLPRQGLLAGRAPWLGWIPPLLQHLGGDYDRIALRGGGGGGGGGGGNIVISLGLSRLSRVLDLSGKLL